MISITPMTLNNTNTARLTTRIAALEARSQREDRIELLEEENRWLKAQLFGRSSEKSPLEELNPGSGLGFSIQAVGADRRSWRRPAEHRHSGA